MYLTDHSKGIRLIMFSTLLVFSSHVLAETIIHQLLGDTLLQTKSLQIVIYKLAGQKEFEAPAHALSEDDYQHLITEIRKLQDEYYPSGNASLSEDDNTELDIRVLDLSARVRMLIDNVNAGYCDASSFQLHTNDPDFLLDLDTARQSNGDWSVVKNKLGKPIKPSSYLHRMLFDYYLAGCNGKKDFAIARKILFDISDLSANIDSTSRNDLRSTIRHCQAEIWAKFGIGGPISEVKAREFSRRFTKEAWFPNSKDTPEARKRIAERLEYQHVIRDNFACPELNKIDPRNPWHDLW